MSKLFLLPHESVAALTMYDTFEDTMVIGSVIPEKTRNITLQSDRGTEKARIKTPTLLWTECINRGVYNNRDFHVYAMKTTKKGIKIGLFNMANQNEDGVCWGHSGEKSVPLNLRDAHETFFNSAFTPDMSDLVLDEDFKKFVLKYKPDYEYDFKNMFDNIVCYKKHADAIFFSDDEKIVEKYKKYSYKSLNSYNDEIPPYIVGFAKRHKDTGVWTVDLKGETFELTEKEKSDALKKALLV